jgi:hypothetical protein
MTLQCVKANSFAGKLLSDLLDENDPIYILDVGASGGIEEHWSAFGAKLKADGFDPLLDEVARLNETAPDSVTYWGAFIDGGGRLGSSVSPHPEDVYLTAFNRTTASEYGRIKNHDYRKEVFNRGEELRYSDERFSLDEFMETNARPTPNFLKIDTDGSDFLVLQGANTILSDPKCLGVQVECQFHGRPDPQSNTFANIDILMRSNGFRLFHLEHWKYSRVEFPSHFVYEIAAQTVEGGIQWGEALYIRDPITNGQFQSFLNQNPGMLLKFLCIAVTMGQFDLAASAISGLHDEFYTDDTYPFAKVLDAMAQDQHPNTPGYKQLIDTFRADPDDLMPSRRGKAVLTQNRLTWIRNLFNGF